LAVFGSFPGARGAHVPEGPLGLKLFLTFGLFSAFSEELVVHLPEWTTSSNKSPALIDSAGL